DLGRVVLYALDHTLLRARVLLPGGHWSFLLRATPHSSRAESIPLDTRPMADRVGIHRGRNGLVISNPIRFLWCDLGARSVHGPVGGSRAPAYTLGHRSFGRHDSYAQSAGSD